MVRADLEVRAATEEEWPAFVRTTNTGFGSLPGDDDVTPERRSYEIERSVAAIADGQIVGTAGAFTFDMTLPGLTTAPTAGVTWVSVLPTHRRRGVLTSMMRHQLDDIRDRGEPLAILLASESIIYGRFGYGLATVQAEYELPRAHRHLARPHEPAGRVLLIDENEAKKQIPQIFEKVRRLQPADVSRPEGWWAMFFRGSKPSGNAGARFYVVYEGATGEVEGYAYYRVGNASQGFGTSASMVQGLGATTLDAYLSLWTYVTDIDLTDRTTTTSRPVEEPLRHLLADPRRLKATSVSDFLWCRIVDLPAALAARRYPIEARFTIEVVDDFCPWNSGRWIVDGGPDGATCERDAGGGAAADLQLSARDLGAVYLGGTRLAVLAQAGRVAGRDADVIRRGDAFFASDVTPYCQTFF
ncbi:MAG TPA: GNAT family N-acetyltransferase [Acidimicrobiales bacterium]|jgi:predicted acetyltransferase|nr:GNAT family N-acetyltransferase [Acidimicrobiales bacterium]